MASVDKEKIREKKNEIIHRKKGGPTKIKQAKWTQILFPEKKEKRRVYIRKLNNLSKPMPKRFWYGRKILY